MKLSNELTELLEIEHSIVQVPMAGQATPPLAVAVTNAGGLGGVGCSYMSADEIEQCVAELRAGTDGSFNLNFLAHPEPRRDAAVDARTRERLAPFYAELGIDDVPTTGVPPCGTFGADQVEVLTAL